MMGYYGYGYMHGSQDGYLGFLTWFLVIIDLALLAVWLWKKVSKDN